MLIEQALMLEIKEKICKYSPAYQMAAVAQLVRALACDAGCREFESRQPPHLTLCEIKRS